MKKIIPFVLMVVLALDLGIAQFGYDNPNLPRIEPPIQTGNGTGNQGGGGNLTIGQIVAELQSYFWALNGSNIGTELNGTGNDIRIPAQSISLVSDTTNFGDGVGFGTVQLIFQHASNIGNIRWNGVGDEFSFLDDVRLEDSETLYANLNTSDLNFTLGSVDCPEGNYSFGLWSNGTMKCRSDNSSGGGGTADFTNVAYLNNTQTFTGNNTYSSLTNFTAPVVINGVQNISWAELLNYPLCLTWRRTTATNFDICKISDSQLRIQGTNIILRGSTINLGGGQNNPTTITVDTSGSNDGSFQYDGTLARWLWTKPIFHTVTDTMAFIPGSTLGPNNNLSFRPLFGDEAYFNGIDVFMPDLNFSGNINGCTATQVVMGDGRCAENNTIGNMTQGGGGGAPSQDIYGNFIIPKQSDVETDLNPLKSSSYGGAGFNSTSTVNPVGWYVNTSRGTINFSYTGVVDIDFAGAWHENVEEAMNFTLRNNTDVVYQNLIWCTMGSLENPVCSFSIPLVINVHNGQEWMVNLTANIGGNINTEDFNVRVTGVA